MSNSTRRARTRRNHVSKRRRLGATYGAFCWGYGWICYMQIGLSKDWHQGERWYQYKISLTNIGLSTVVMLVAVIWGLRRGDYDLSTRSADDDARFKASRLCGVLMNLGVLVVLMSLIPFLAEINAANPQAYGLIASGVFSVLAIALGIREMTKHWLNYHKPKLQKHVVRILAIVPVYTIDAYAVLLACTRKADFGELCTAPDSPEPQNATAAGSWEDFSEGQCAICLHSQKDHAACNVANCLKDCSDTGSCYESPGVLFLNILRELYEAYTLYSFFVFMTLQLVEVAKERKLKAEIEGAAQTPREAPSTQQAAETDAEDSTLSKSFTIVDELGPEPGLGPAVLPVSSQQQPDEDGLSARLFTPITDVGNRLAKEASQFQADQQQKRRDNGRRRRVIMMRAEGIEDDEQQLLYDLLVDQGQPQHQWYGIPGCGPGRCCNWLKPWEKGEKWLSKCRIGVLQYVVIELFMSLLILFARLEWFGLHYGETEGLFNFRNVYPYSTFLISASQCWALYCLIHFYHETRDLLHPIKPLLKFVSIKLIVFFTFWQMVTINFLFAFCAFQGLHLECNFGLPVPSFSAGLQACLICVEMFVAAVLHRQVFAYRDYRLSSEDRTNEPLRFWAAVKDTFNNSDIQHAVSTVVVAGPDFLIGGVIPGVWNGVGGVVGGGIDVVKGVAEVGGDLLTNVIPGGGGDADHGGGGGGGRRSVSSPQDGGSGGPQKPPPRRRKSLSGSRSNSEDSQQDTGSGGSQKPPPRHRKPAAEPAPEPALAPAPAPAEESLSGSVDTPQDAGSGAADGLKKAAKAGHPAAAIQAAAAAAAVPAQELAEGHVAAIAPRNDAQKKKDEEAAHQGEMGRRLKEAGAKVGALTCSLMWHNRNDLDLHCESPTGSHIFYAQRTGTCTGVLDVDANARERECSDKPIENILWHNPPKGHYRFWVEAVDMDRSAGKTEFSVRLTKNGQAEEKTISDIEEDGELPVFEFDM
jgi:hypothetical protein